MNDESTTLLVDALVEVARGGNGRAVFAAIIGALSREAIDAIVAVLSGAPVEAPVAAPAPTRRPRHDVFDRGEGPPSRVDRCDRYGNVVAAPRGRRIA